MFHHTVYLFTAWMLAAIATAGSLFFSEVLLFPPCILCWYQRICMYPLVVILGIGFLREERSSALYSAALAFIGWGIAVYHNLLYYEILPESAAPCMKGISCTTRFIEWFGFITIPSLALFAFTIILILLVLYMRENNEK